MLVKSHAICYALWIFFALLKRSSCSESTVTSTVTVTASCSEDLTTASGSPTTSSGGGSPTTSSGGGSPFVSGIVFAGGSSSSNSNGTFVPDGSSTGTGGGGGGGAGGPNATGSSSGSSGGGGHGGGSGSGSTGPTGSVSGGPGASASGSGSQSMPTGSSSGANSTSSGSGGNSTSSSNSTTALAAPRFAIYTDMWADDVLPDPSEMEGYNAVILSFLLASGAADQAQAWEQLDSSKRTALKQSYNGAGIKVMVSAFGSTEKPTSSGTNAASCASQMASWVKKYDLDGIDVDWEDSSFDTGDGSGEKWLVEFTQTLRQELPAGQYLLTHAPQSPWFQKGAYKGGAYITVNEQVGSEIDWYNIQYYNQGDSETCETQITKSTNFPGTAILEMMDAGYPQDKLVIGKPATSTDASNGYIDPSTLAGCVSQAKEKGWNAGVMVWEYPHADAQWIKTVRSQAFPVGSTSSSSNSNSTSTSTNSGDSSSSSVSSASSSRSSGSSASSSSSSGKGGRKQPGTGNS